MTYQATDKATRKQNDIAFLVTLEQLTVEGQICLARLDHSIYIGDSISCKKLKNTDIITINRVTIRREVPLPQHDKHVYRIG